MKSSPGLRAIYNNLRANPGPAPRKSSVAQPKSTYSASGNPALDLAIRIDSTVRKAAPDAWRGIHAREQVVKAALNEVLHDFDEVERVFLIVKAQAEY